MTCPAATGRATANTAVRWPALMFSTAAASPKPTMSSTPMAISGVLRRGLCAVRRIPLEAGRLPWRVRGGRVVVAVIVFSSAVVDRLHFRDTDGDSGRLVERTQGSAVRAVRPCHRPGDGGLHCECILGLAAALAGRRVLVGVGAGL